MPSITTFGRGNHAITTRRWSYIQYFDGSAELYDREKDPLETKNFANDPAYAETVAQLKAEIQRLRVEVKETGEPPRHAYGNRPFDNEPQSQQPAPQKKAGGKKKQ